MPFSGIYTGKNKKRSAKTEALQAQARRKCRERVSVFASGSITVETAFALPLFLFIMTAVLLLGDVMILKLRLQGAMEAEVQQAAAVLAVIGQEGQEQTVGQLGNGINGDFYTVLGLRAAVISKVGRNWLEEKRVKGGAEGISFAGSSVDDEVVDLIAAYQVKIPIPILGNQYIHCMQRCRRKIWSGFSSGENNSEDMVYVTSYGAVYHESLNCSHLNLSAREVDFSELEFLRNNAGAKYRPCERCITGAHGGRTFITSDGDCYHGTISCSGLTRGIRTITRKEAEEENLKPCSRCGGG